MEVIINYIKHCSRRGFTLVEIVLVLAIVGMLTAVAVPSMLKFGESGKRVNRMNIARTIYLAAQDQLAQLQITKNLKAEITGALYYDKVDGKYKENDTKLESHNNVSAQLTRTDLGFDHFPPEEKANGNEKYIHYISKAKTDPSNPETSDNNLVLKLLAPVIMDNSILNDAIIIEYNIKTGRVLSVFYGDTIDSFAYGESDSDGDPSNITGGRGMDKYRALAELRNQGYYGVEDTGKPDGTGTEVLDDILASSPYISVYDSHLEPLPEEADAGLNEAQLHKNVFYASVLIPKKYVDNKNKINLLINGKVVENNVDFTALTEHADSLTDALSLYGGVIHPVDSTALLYRHDGDIGPEYARIIWVLDYISGNTEVEPLQHSIAQKYKAKVGFDGTEAVSFSVQVIEDSGNMSPLFELLANPYFTKDSSAGKYTVESGRHLYNIRNLENAALPTDEFRQKLDIDLAMGSDAITNFKPIPELKGIYDGTGYVIENLLIRNSLDNNVGLFRKITGSVKGLALKNPDVEGKENVGALCGELTVNGSATGIYISYEDMGAETLRTIHGEKNVGGIAGVNKGSITDSVFISPTENLHIYGNAKDSAGGFVGNNDGGSIENMLFLALAPRNMERINPIIGVGALSNTDNEHKLYYLSGTAISPEKIPNEDGGETTNYNAESPNSEVVALSTDEMFEFILDKGNPGSNELNEYWDKIPNTSENIDPLSRATREYPYPYYNKTKLSYEKVKKAEYPQWPIVEHGGSIKLRDLAYFEKYADNSYGLWTADNGNTSNGSLRDNKVILEAGYVIILDKNISGENKLFVRRTAPEDIAWTDDDFVANLTFSGEGDSFTDAISGILGKKVWTFKFPLEILAKIENQTTPLQIMHALVVGSENQEVVNGVLQPLFAKGLYRESAEPVKPKEFFIRTPWQMRNITVLTADSEDETEYTEDIIFKQEINLNFENTGEGVGFAWKWASEEMHKVVDGIFKGTYDGNGKSISNLKIEAAEPDDNVGLFKENGNKGIIQNLALKSSVITGKENVGAIAGNNRGTVEHCIVEGSTVSGETKVGGIVGNNYGNVENITFLSTAEIESSPVSNTGGGIVGYNNEETGNVMYAFYLAPAPSIKDEIDDITTIFPIVREGAPAAEIPSKENPDTKHGTSFYLAGSSYSKDSGNTTIYNNYNRIVRSDSIVQNSGGGIGLITEFIDVAWINYAYEAELTDWVQPTRGYPYPVLKDMLAPSSWPVAYSPVRPDQLDSDTWERVLPTSNRANNLGFINGDFSDNYSTAGKKGTGSENGYNIREYVEMSYINGWNTRPVKESERDKANASWIELQTPVRGPASSAKFKDYANVSYKGEGEYGKNIDSYANRYVELNAELQGTLYQICPTTPGAQFYYSFYHMSRLNNKSDNPIITDALSFYLTGVSNEALYAEDADLVMIRPCWSPRKQAITEAGGSTNTPTITDYNPVAKNSIAYGNTNDLSYHKYKFNNFPANGKPYLYDVWVSDLDYGITFWSTANVSVGSGNSNIPTAGVTKIDNLPSSIRSDAANNIIGYWGVEYGWKHYYGLYTVPQGQVRTEFAYQSNTANATAGNFLDGVSFKSPAFLSINKFIKMEGENVKFVKPGDPLTVELYVESWGEMPADNIVIKDRLSPFTEYIEYAGKLSVKKGSTTITGSTVTLPSDNNGNTLTITLPRNTTLNAGEGLTVTFDINVLSKVKSTVDKDEVETLLYYFKNQAAVEYRQDKEKNTDNFDAYINQLMKNASGPEPVQIFIDPIKLSKTVKTVGVSGTDTLINGPFMVDLTIANILEGSNSIETTGLINDIIPKGFTITDKGTLPEHAIFTANSDGTTRITIQNVNLDEDIREVRYSYKLEYTGNDYGGKAYGVSYISTSADYKYLYRDEGNEALNVMLKFPMPVVGIKIKTSADEFIISGKKTHVLDIISNDNFAEKLADDNYDVTPEVILTDSSGNAVSKNGDENYYLNPDGFTATLIKGSNNLEFVPKITGSNYTLYYKIKLTAAKTGGTPEKFELTSDVKEIKITVQ